MARDEVVLDNPSADQMFLDDPLEHRRIAPSIPRALGVHDRNRAAFADAEAVRFGAQNAALLRQAELLQPALQKIPCLEAARFLAALRIRLIAAEQNVAARAADADRFGDLA